MTDAQLATAWRTEIDSVPIPVLIDTETAVAVIQKAQQR